MFTIVFNYLYLEVVGVSLVLTVTFNNLSAISWRTEKGIKRQHWCHRSGILFKEIKEDCQKSCDALKQALISAPILTYPTREHFFILDTDASNVGMGFVLSQVQDGQEKVISYYNKSFNKAERKYCVTRRELLPVVASIKNFHHYLYGRKFKVRSDHGALSWLFNFKNSEGQLTRWFELSTLIGRR